MWFRAPASVAQGIVAAVALLAHPEASAAQQRSRTLFSVSAGSSGGELPAAGERVGPLWAVRVERTIVGFVVLEPGLAVFMGNEWDFFPELSLQMEAPYGLVRPYIGGGVGYALLATDSNRGTLHLVGGIRFVPKGNWGLRAEIRPRLLPDGWYIIDATVGVSWRIR